MATTRLIAVSHLFVDIWYSSFAIWCAPYSNGAKYCSGCRIYLLTGSRTCPCCSVRLRTKPRRGRMTENKTQLSNYFSRAKRKFVNLKEMEMEDEDQFLICEFRGYHFEILPN
jgi:hypothetical protein